jgi:hypothetical protein
MTLDPKAPQGAVADETGNVAARAAEAVPSPTVGGPTPGSNLQPGETVAGATGQPAPMHKTLVSSVAGAITNVDQAAANRAFTPAVDPQQQQGAPGQPGGGRVTQPGETIGGADGSMVTATPSASGTGTMEPGVGNRS